MVAKATKDVVCDSDFATQTVWFSDGMQEVFGHPYREVTWQWWTDQIHPDDLPRVSDLSGGIVDGTKDIFVAQYRFRRADGTYADVNGRGFVVRDAEGKSARIIGTMTDVTEQKAAEAAMVTSQQRLQAL